LLMSKTIEILQIFYKRSVHELNAFHRIYIHVLLVIIQKLLTLYKFTKVQRFFQNIPMGIMSGSLLKGSILHPRPYIQKIHCILQVDRGEATNILQVLGQ
jgi:hypothetical protein